MRIVLPPEWSLVKLTDVAEVWFSGVDKKSDPNEQPVRLCNYVDVFRNLEIRPNLPFMKATATISEIKRNRLAEGDVVFTKDSETVAEIAECSLVTESADDIVCGYHLAVARPNPDRLLGAFLAQAMRFPMLRHQFVRSANGVVRYGLTLEAVGEVNLCMPPIREQARIAKLLNTWDQAIESSASLLDAERKRLIATAKRMIWNDQDDWRPLSDFMVPSRARVGAGRSLEVFSVTRDGLKPQLEHFNKRISNENITRHMLLRPGEFALSGLNFWLGSVAVSDLKEDVCISPDYKVFHLNGKANSAYFKHLVRTDGFRELLVNCSTERASVVRRNFNRELFFQSEIPVPHVEEQKKRAEALDAIAASIRAAERRISLLTAQKSGLMQKLLTGELRLDQRFDDLAPAVVARGAA
ncbi:MAG: restriction endonuclease subunit S [Xanthobacteraceae bacterium]